jgi:hypothetical protein
MESANPAGRCRALAGREVEMVKRTYRITVSVTQQEWDFLHWVAYEDSTTPATSAYKLMLDGMARLLAPGGQLERRWAAHRVLMAEKVGQVKLPME